MDKSSDIKTIDEYIASFPENTQKILKKIRKLISEMIPNATEGISYQIPAFFIDGKYFIYFAGYSKHVAIYPIHPDQFSFAKELEKYQSGKATLKFPLEEEIPYELIRKIVKYKLDSK